MASNTLHNRPLVFIRKLCRPPPPPVECDHVCCQKAVVFHLVSTVYYPDGSLCDQKKVESVAAFAKPLSQGCQFRSGWPFRQPPCVQVGFSFNEVQDRLEIYIAHAVSGGAGSSSGGPSAWGTPQNGFLIFQAIVSNYSFRHDRINVWHDVSAAQLVYLDGFYNVSQFSFLV